MSSNQSPTVVLVHGAWHSPEHMSKLTTYLESNGYKVLAPRLPSMHAEDLTKVTLTEDITAIRSDILKALKTSNVVVMAHSYGALPSSGALEGLDTASRTSSGHNNSVTSFLIIAGLLVPPGFSVLGYFGGKPAPPQDVRGPLLYPRDPPGPGYLLYHDVPFDEAKQCCETLKPQAWAVNSTVLPHAGHLVVPTRYMICIKDNILPSFVQQSFVDKAREELAGKGSELTFEADTIDSSHSPFLSQTEVVGTWIRKYGGGEDGLKVDL